MILLSFAQCVKVWNDHNSLPAQYLIDLAQYFFSLVQYLIDLAQYFFSLVQYLIDLAQYLIDLAQYGHLETVKLLLDAGADPNIKNRLKI